MKVTVKDSPNGNEVKFPCLMTTNGGHIFLMMKYGCGVVIKSYPGEFGGYSEDWDMSQFTLFKGTVELSND